MGFLNNDNGAEPYTKQSDETADAMILYYGLALVEQSMNLTAYSKLLYCKPPVSRIT